jgi:site-specific DNA recombinase
VASVSHLDVADMARIVLYCRVSTEDQAERQTVKAQLDFLRNWAQLFGHPIVGEYVDDGVSGTVPLEQRPEGQRLLAELPETRPNQLAVYRLDRLGRSARVLLDADALLTRAGVTIQSATEPFNTASPIGRFVFQLLGSIAELERSTITERMTMGRDRVARDGKWTGGPIPFGFDLDAEGRLVPSARIVPTLGVTEAQLVREIYQRLADGSTLIVECHRLNALGVPAERRYAQGKVVQVAPQWGLSRLSKMVRNPIYHGKHILRSQRGTIERAVPPLVSRELWETVQRQLTSNRALSEKNATRPYLLRGLITCEHCGHHFNGTSHRKRAGAPPTPYYRCNSQLASIQLDRGQRCRAKILSASWLEALVWQDCREFISNPGDALVEAQRQLQAQQAQVETLVPQQRALEKQIAAKDTEREKVMTFFRRNLITAEEAERQLTALAQERDQLQGLANALTAQTALAQATEAQLTEASSMLTGLRGRLAEIDRTDEWPLKRQIIELLVAEIRVRTEQQGTRKQAALTIRYHFGQSLAVDSTTPSPSPLAPAPSSARTSATPSAAHP